MTKEAAGFSMSLHREKMPFFFSSISMLQDSAEGTWGTLLVRSNRVIWF